MFLHLLLFCVRLRHSVLLCMFQCNAAFSTCNSLQVKVSQLKAEKGRVMAQLAAEKARAGNGKTTA